MWLCEKPWMKRIPGRWDCPNPAPKWSGYRLSSPRSVCISIPVRNSVPPLRQATKWQRSPSAGSKFAAILSSEILPRVADCIVKYVLQDRSKSLLVVTPQMPLTTNESRIHRHSTVSVGNGWQCSPCSLLLRFRDSVLAALLSPNSRATMSPSGVRQRFLQTRQCPAPLRAAYDLAIDQELCAARQCFWACSA